MGNKIICKIIDMFINLSEKIKILLDFNRHNYY